MAKRHSVPSLTLERREEAGTTAAHRLRRAGKVPGVVYGHGDPTPVAIEAKHLAEFLHSGDKAHIVEARIAGTKDSVLVRRIEADPLTRRPLNVDFQRVTRDEEIFASVAVTTVGTARGVRDAGAVLDVVTHQLDIKGPAHGIPDALTIDVSELALHDHVTAAQVALPKGFALVTAPDTIVVSVEISRAAVSVGVEEELAPEVPAAAPAAAPTE
ncbi:MAG TPA: 50S ribosomal protein L25 [Candidatus Limnocylindria bacterium]|jgi:large subunit ribosomal protein L25|nr:50S ribosomal protein L25 [Candidatus Limnocylindria bacterium]